MKTIETERLILRELLLSDKEGMFELDSNPNVHLFLGNRPVKHIEESIEQIENIQKQYKDFGIVTTQKDFVKLEQFDLNNLYIMDLKILSFDNPPQQ